MIFKLVKRYPFTFILATILVGLISSSSFTWPTLGLLQYALGFAGGRPAQVAMFAAQYGSAANFWGSLAITVGKVSLITFVVVKFILWARQQISIMVRAAQLRNPVRVPFGASEEVQSKALNQEKARVAKLLDTIIVISREEMIEIIKPFAKELSQIFEKAVAQEQGKKGIEKAFASATTKEEAIKNCGDDVTDGVALEFSKLVANVLLKFKQVSVVINNFPLDRQAQIVNLFPQVFYESYRDVLIAGIKPQILVFITKYANEHGIHLLGTIAINEKFIDQNMTPYSVLQIDQKAAPETIKLAYKKLSLAHHPDKNGGQVSAMWEHIQVAQQLLLDENCRRNLDKLLAAKNIIVTPILKPEGVKQDSNLNKDKPQEPKVQDTPVLYWEDKMKRYLTQDANKLEEKGKRLKKERNDLLKTFGFSEDHPFRDRMDDIVANNSIPQDAHGHVIQSTNNKEISALKILNLKTQLLFLKEAQTNKLARNQVPMQYKNEDYHALVGKNKIKMN